MTLQNECENEDLTRNVSIWISTNTDSSVLIVHISVLPINVKMS